MTNMSSPIKQNANVSLQYTTHTDVYMYIILANMHTCIPLSLSIYTNDNKYIIHVHR